MNDWEDKVFVMCFSAITCGVVAVMLAFAYKLVMESSL